TYDAKKSMTGEHFSGVARSFPAAMDALGNDLGAADEAEGFEMQLITYKSILSTKSRSSGNYWLRAVEPNNFVTINSVDARRLGFAQGDKVNIVYKTNPRAVWEIGNGVEVPMIGEIEIIEGLRPGVVGFNLGYGHWAYGAG